MKIFFYNWVQFDDPENRGGGVTLYQRNLIEALISQEHEVIFLSSGVAYNLLTKRSYIRKTRNSLSPDCKSFDLVNSPVLAPSHNSFDLIEAQFNDTMIRPMLVEFLTHHGPFDVVHFNNFEGLPFAALDLKSTFPGRRFIYSAHNYFAVCPQVNLWQEEARNCTDFEHGKKCISCLQNVPNKTEERLANGLAFHLKSIGILPETFAFRAAFKIARFGNRLISRLISRRRQRQKSTPTPKSPPPGMDASRGFSQRRKKLVALIERNFDTILAVSSRTKAVLATFGFDPERIETSYIGTKHGEAFNSQTTHSVYEPGQPLRVAYLGYMRADKGFWFLLDALENMPETLSSKMELVIAARDTGKGGRERLEKLRGKYLKINYFDGYTQDALDDILANTHIGIVPPLWEDNLPQVAIEIMSRRIPLLTSGLGGAQELGNNPDFVFQAGAGDELHDRLAAIIEGKLAIADYWQNNLSLKTMHDHIEELMEYYQKETSSKEMAAAE